MDEYLMEIMAQRSDQELESRIRDQQTYNSLNPRLTPEEFLAENCEECDEELPLFRKQCGLVMCVPCQERADNISKRNGR